MRQFLALSHKTYWLPRPAIEPSRTAALAGSLADLPRDLRREPRLGRPIHETQYLLGLLVRNESEKRGLFQLHGQPLPKRLVKDRIARLVFEFGQDNRVLRREFRRPVQIKVPSGAQCQDRSRRPQPSASSVSAG